MKKVVPQGTKKTKPTPPKKMPYLFPVEDIQFVQLKERTIFHRQKTSVGLASMLGPTDEYIVQGFCILEKPDGKPKKELILGTFTFKGSAQLPRCPRIEIRDEHSLRFVMAAIVLGESTSRYHLKNKKINIGQGPKSGKLFKRQEILRRWDQEWTGKKFQDRCKKEKSLPLHEAALSLLSSGIEMTPEHLKKHLRELKLPL